VQLEELEAEVAELRQQLEQVQALNAGKVLSCHSKTGRWILSSMIKRVKKTSIKNTSVDGVLDQCRAGQNHILQPVFMVTVCFRKLEIVLSQCTHIALHVLQVLVVDSQFDINHSSRGASSTSHCLQRAAHLRAENQSFDCAEKLEKAADALSSMEKRAVMAESMLEVTILSQETANSKAHGTVRSTQDDRPQEGIYRSHSSPSPMYSSHSLI
jgi:hypothetical protein